MRLTCISVEGVGRFGDAVTISGLEPGLNVLAAPNEAGKSTLFRAVRACLFQKHTAKTDDLRKLARDGAGLPVTIELGFEHGGAHYVARKSFLSSMRASLLKDGREIASGRAADDEIYNVLGLKPGGGREIDAGAYGLLWVGQSDSFDPPVLNGAAKDAVSEAIEREVGVLAGGDRARQALKTIDAQLDPLFNKNGSPARNGPLGLAEARLADTVTRLAADAALLGELDRDIEALEDARKRREKAQDPRVEADLRTRLRASQQEREDARAAAAVLREREKDEQLALRPLEDARRAYDDLATCAKRIDDTQARVQAQEAALAPLESDQRVYEASLDKARATLAEMDAREAEDARAEAHLRRLASAAAAAAARPALLAKLARLEAIARDLAVTKAARVRIAVTDKDVQALEKAERDIALLTDRLDAAAPRIEITPAAQPLSTIRIGDRAIDAPTTLAATGRTTIDIANVGVIVLTPPPGFGEKEREDLRKLQTAHAALLARLGQESLASVRDLLDDARGHDQTLRALEAQLTALETTESDLPAQAQKTRDRIEAANAAMAMLGDEAPPSPAEIDDRQASLQARREETVGARKRLQSDIDALNKRLLALAAQRAQARAQLTELNARLAADLQRLPMAERAARLAEAAQALENARASHEAARIDLEAQRARAPDADKLADIESRVARHESALRNIAEERRAMDERIVRLETAIQTRGGDGLGERVAALREEQGLAERDIARLRANAAALTLLRDTIRGCYEEQRNLLQKPIRRHLQPFLDDLFPRSELTLDESFSVSGLMRDGAPEAFTRLSDGTQEQIAVLVRLAMGGLLHERGEDVPIILDDALVFCDDERIERMFDALNRAARRQQVIVLTCRGASFRSLGGKALDIAPLGRSLR